MSSQSRPTAARQSSKPTRSSLPADDVKNFRKALRKALVETDGQGRKWASAQWGVYAFYDYDGEPVSEGLRRVLVIQAVRLAYISAVRLAHAEGRSEPDAGAINVEGLVGSVLYEHYDPSGDKSSETELGIYGNGQIPSERA